MNVEMGYVLPPRDMDDLYYCVFAATEAALSSQCGRCRGNKQTASGERRVVYVLSTP
jgi:hypothetical protein